MKSTTGRIGIVVGIALVSAGSVSTGQVRQIGGGQALDASLQVGSGGINYAVPQNYTPNMGMNDLTRTRGLSAFMGHAPSISNQLSVGVNTDGVDRFNRQAVSVQDALRGGPALYAPQTVTYDSPYRTFLRPSDIIKANYGRRVPIAGDQRPTSKNVKLAEDLFVDATANFKPIMPKDVDDMMVGNALSLPRDEGGTSSNYNLWLRTMDSQQLADRGGRDMFGMLRRKDRANLAQEISDFDKADEAPGALDLTVKPDQGVQPVQPIDVRQNPAELNSPEKTDTSVLSTPKKEGASEEDRERNLPKSAAQQTDLRTGLPQTNADPYFDMLVQFRKRQLAENAVPPGNPPGTGVPPGGRPPALPGAATTANPPRDQAPAEPGAETPRTVLHPMDEALLQRMKSAVPMAGRPTNVELTPNNQIIIHRLAGESDDTFNRYMRRAESAMRAQRFYEALRQYNLATVAKPTNPMAHLGVCMAGFASNEWMTGADGLRKAMELFPPLMETRMDLKRLIPIDDWPRQLKVMEQWVTRVDEQPMMLYLATFIEFNFGRTDPAKQYAGKLLTMEKVPKILHAYAQYVKTGKLPANIKTRRKAPPAKK